MTIWSIHTSRVRPEKGGFFYKGVNKAMENPVWEGLLAFPRCDKIAEKINLKDKRFILAHGFRGFSPWLTDSIALVLK